MNLEGITINILTSRLQEKLLGGKIYKVFMPNKSSLLLLVKTENAVIPLAADFSGASPYLYMPDKTPERPETPPAFCMLLRKHLEEGRITKITQSGLDRVSGRRAHYQNNAKRPGPRYYNGNKQHRQRKANYQQTAYF